MKNFLIIYFKDNVLFNHLRQESAKYLKNKNKFN